MLLPAFWIWLLMALMYAWYCCTWFGSLNLVLAVRRGTRRAVAVRQVVDDERDHPAAAASSLTSATKFCDLGHLGRGVAADTLRQPRLAQQLPEKARRRQKDLAQPEEGRDGGRLGRLAPQRRVAQLLQRLGHPRPARRSCWRTSCPPRTGCPWRRPPPPTARRPRCDARRSPRPGGGRWAFLAARSARGAGARAGRRSWAGRRSAHRPLALEGVGGGGGGERRGEREGRVWDFVGCGSARLRFNWVERQLRETSWRFMRMALLFRTALPDRGTDPHRQIVYRITFRNAHRGLRERSADQFAKRVPFSGLLKCGMGGPASRHQYVEGVYREFARPLYLDIWDWVT